MQHVTSHCIITFIKLLHINAGNLVINYSLPTYKCSQLFSTVICYKISNLIDTCMLNISKRNRVTKILLKKLCCEFKCSLRCNQENTGHNLMLLACSSISLSVNTVVQGYLYTHHIRVSRNILAKFTPLQLINRFSII